jgi:hypothetical protein
MLHVVPLATEQKTTILFGTVDQKADGAATDGAAQPLLDLAAVLAVAKSEMISG